MPDFVIRLVYVPCSDGDGYLLGLDAAGRLWRGVIVNGSSMRWHPMPQEFAQE